MAEQIRRSRPAPSRHDAAPPASAVARDHPLQRRAAERHAAHIALLDRRAAARHPIQPKGAGRRSGLPERLKAGVQSLTGLAMDGVGVHYDSGEPARLGARAYAQGRDIHLGPGQERHLPHEAWHVVQQMQGRVAPNARVSGGAALNDDPALEREADAMGARAAASPGRREEAAAPAAAPLRAVVQREPEGTEKEGDQVKIYVEKDDEVLTVYFVSAGPHQVKYRTTKETPKKKGGQVVKDIQTIERRLVFPKGFSDQQVKREVALAASAKESFADLGIKRDKLEVVLRVVKEYIARTKAQVEVQVQLARIVEVVKGDEYLAALVADYGVDELKQALDDEALQQIVDGLGNTSTDVSESSLGAQSSSGASKPEWKTERTKKAKGEALAALRDSREADLAVAKSILLRSTLHHKVSRSRLGDLYTRYKETPGTTPGTGEMADFFRRVTGLTGKGDIEAALDNWVANIELGPKSEDRAEGNDPGENFDGSYPGGIATPRTELLEEVDLIIQSARSGADVPWAKVAAMLETTQDRHEMVAEAQAFSAPNLKQWQQSGKVFVRDKKNPSAKKDVDIGPPDLGAKKKPSTPGQSAPTTSGTSGKTGAVGKSMSSQGSGKSEIVPRDVAKHSGRTYAPSVEGVRDLGQCLWDSLRASGLADAVEKLAKDPGNKVDQAVDLDNFGSIVTSLKKATGVDYRIHVALFDIFTLKFLSERLFGKGGQTIYIGFFYDRNKGQGHYTPALG